MSQRFSRRPFPRAFTPFLATAVLLAFQQQTAARPTPTNPVTYSLAVSPEDLVRSEAAFTPFAKRVATDVDRLLRSDPPTTGAQLQLLLALQVHLAIYFRDDRTALAAAAKIRELQTNPNERAHAGLTTGAIVAANYDPVAFEREFTTLLRALPRNAAMRETLIRARTKISALTQEALISELKEVIAPRLVRGEPCTLELAEQLVRVRHRLKNVLPLREAMLRAYTTAIGDEGKLP